jgi:hypothetical protein
MLSAFRRDVRKISISPQNPSLSHSTEQVMRKLAVVSAWHVHYLLTKRAPTAAHVRYIVGEGGGGYYLTNFIKQSPS